MNPAPLNPWIDELAEQLAQRTAHHLAQKLTPASAREAESPWMSIATAATYLDWSKQRLYKLTAAGRIPHTKIDGRLLFHRHHLDTWLRDHAQGEGWR